MGGVTPLAEEGSPVADDLDDLKGTRVEITFTDDSTLVIDCITEWSHLREDIDAVLSDDEMFVRFLRVDEYFGQTHFVAVSEIATINLRPVTLIEGTVRKRPKSAKTAKSKKTPKSPAKKRKVSDG